MAKEVPAAWTRSDICAELAAPADGCRPLHVAVDQPALAAAAMVDPVRSKQVARRNRILRRELGIDQAEIRACRIHELLEAVDHEIGLLEGVDTVACAHDPSQIE